MFSRDKEWVNPGFPDGFLGNFSKERRQAAASILTLDFSVCGLTLELV